MKRGRTVDVSLPAHVSERFERQLRHLVNQLSSQGFAGEYLRKEIFSKYLDPELVSPDVRATAALAKWQAAEARNRTTNLRLMMAQCGVGGDFGWTTFDDFVAVVRANIRRVLGPLRYPGVLFGATFTNGASTRIRRGPAAAVRKLAGELHITDSAIKHWLAMASGSRLSRQPLRIVPSSVQFTVPKKTEIDRVACKEPEGNALLQRAVGQYIRQRLLVVAHIDLRDQRRNQRLASRGWSDGLATIDLSSASDTVSSGLVQLLLPFDWWHLLSDLRVGQTVLIDGELHELEMFSSMGNGFTFELESLIFWAMARAVVSLSQQRGEVSVYGDDIIVPCSIARRFVRVIEFFGFMPNRKKTHVTGPFRESCGRHYWKGLDVTPFYVRKAVTTLPELINTLNHLLEWDGRGWGTFTTKEAYEFWVRWVGTVPSYLWGGIDPADPTALVTGHPPRKRLVPVTRALQVDEEARLTTWLHRRDTDRGGSPAMAVDPAETYGFIAKRFVSAGERTTWYPHLAFSQ